MIFLNKKLIISYIPYAYKDGGFCITLDKSNLIRKEEVGLSEKEIEQLLKPSLRYNNETPIFLELLKVYLNELKNDFVL